MIALIIIVSLVVLILTLEIWVRLVIDPWLKDNDPDNDGEIGG